MAARLILLAAMSGAAFAQEPRPGFLSYEDLKALLSETKTIQFATGRSTGIAVLGKDGTASVDGGTFQARGTWRIDGDKYCSKYPGIRRGYETCYTVQDTGGGTYKLYSTDGDVSSWVIQK